MSAVTPNAEDPGATDFGAGIWQWVRPRLPWLVSLLFLEMVSGKVVDYFQADFSPATLAVLAVFITTMAGETGNAATQALAVVVRSLATGEVTSKDILQVGWRETRVGLTAGAACGVVLAGLAYVMKGDWHLSVVVGLAISAVGLFQMAHFNLEVDFRTAMMARVVQSAGLAFLFVPINTMAFAFVPKPRTNYATGLINLARNIGGSAGIAVVTTVLARRSQFHQQTLVGHMTPLDPAYQQALEGARQMLMTQGASAADALAQAQGLLYGMMQRQAAMKAFIDNFWMMGMIFLAMIPLMFFMRRTAPGKGAGDAAAH
jgi:hypothetical protein